MELTHKLLLANGWEQDEKDEDEFCFKRIEPYKDVTIYRICCVEKFCTFLMLDKKPYGEFTTTEDLQTIFKALFKFDLKFEDNESR